MNFVKKCVFRGASISRAVSHHMSPVSRIYRHSLQDGNTQEAFSQINTYNSAQ